ncbi:MAG: amidohydrolase family protein [Desulfovibrio sp.]|nr:amidohydrolase family protein [Desulfovibrio sp.]
MEPFAPFTHDPASEKPEPQALAIRAKSVVTLAGEDPARGARLFAPLKKIDNAVLIVRDGMVEEVRAWSASAAPAGALVRDLGPVCLAPACVNAHTHLELSHLAERTRWGKGFTAWLQSLIPLLREAPNPQAAENACAHMAGTGTLYAGNITGSLPGGLLLADAACRGAGLAVNHFCEWFGFGAPFADGVRPWPPRCRDPLEEDPFLAARCSPGGHGLYSTGPDILRAAKQDCASMGRIFCFHLAESPDETQLLTTGDGPLRECYEQAVLPPDWQAPGLRPLAYAFKLGLLDAGTLAVHGTQLDAQEVEVLAASGAALCMCPRSNRNLGVGVPPVRDLLESGCLLCLGTDGLTSNRDLDVRQEAVWLRENLDVPPEALVRLMTINGAEALNMLQSGAGRLEPGSPADFCVLPEALTY